MSARCFGDVTGSHTRWVAVCPPALPIEQSIFGPFQSEEEVTHWLALNKRDGQPLQIGEPS